MMVLLLVMGCHKSDDAVPGASVPTYSISGVVGYGGSPDADVMVKLYDASSTVAEPASFKGAAPATSAPAPTALATCTTGADGYYVFSGLANGNYIVKPTKTGRIFTSVSLAVGVLGASRPNQDFDSTADAASTYTISGTVDSHLLEGVSGVKIDLSGDNSGSTFTDESGYYSFSGLVNGNYTVTPLGHTTVPGLPYTFTPDHRDPIINVASATGVDFTANFVGATFAQADLEGTWAFNQLRASGYGGYGGEAGADGWTRGTVTVNAAGVLSVSCTDSKGSCGGVVGTVTWTIDAAGVITESGSPNNHYTMASNKQFITGTGTGGHLDDARQLMIIQKVVTGTGYAASDVYNKNLVYHQLDVGNATRWEYGYGGTSATGALNIDESTTPTGPTTPGDVGVTLAVNGWGVVTMSGSGMETFRGFLSTDKKTIVGTSTDNSGAHMMMIIQITGQAYKAGLAPNSVVKNHMLVVDGEQVAPPHMPFWAHNTITIAGGTGVMTSSLWVSDPTMSDPSSGTAESNIDATGYMYNHIDETSYHGQVSHDGMFTVGTLTPNTDYYTLSVTTR